MDREKLRESLPAIPDASVRQAETSRIEGNYNLEIALAHLFIERKGRRANPEELDKVVSAVKVLLYDRASDAPEKAERIKYANAVLDAEFR